MAQNIIGNTSYGEIKDKKYIDSTAVNIQMLAERLQAENIRFSGRINDWKATITVDGEADKARALQILKEVEALNGNQRMYIGNKQYRYISDKKITSMSAEEARVIANYLTKNNVVFSGVIEGEKARITVSGDAALADVKRVLDMYRNKDIVKELAAHGYMLVDDKSEDADIINVRDTRHTGEVRGFESLEAVRAALNDINNDFFHPTEYRIATSAYFNDTLYYISASDAVSGEERGAVREAGAAVTFETVSEALSYCENNGITISNSEEDIEKFRILEDDAETKRITAENEKYTAMLDSSVEYTNYDPQNGILKVCYIGEYSGKAAIIENTVTDTDILAAHNNNYANPVDYFTFLDVQSSTRIVSSDEAEYASMADTLLDGNYRKVNRTAEGLEALRHDTEMFCKPIQEQRRAQALKAEDISKLADVIEQTAQHVSDNNALNLFGYGKDFNEGNTADYAFSFNDSLSLRENIVASLESGKTAWLGVWAEEISTHIPAQEYEAVNNALNFFMDKYNCHFNMSDIQHVTYSITLTSDAFDEPYALAVEDIYGDFVDYVKDSNGDIPTFDNVDEAVKYAEMEHIKITNSAAEIEEWRVIDKELKENSDHIKVEGHRGTWYVIDTDIIGGKQLFLLEHETYGDEAAGLIVDKDRNIVMDEVYNGFADLFDAFPELEPQEEPENKQPDMNNSVTNSQTAKTLPETRFTSISQKTRGYLNFHTFIAMPEDSPWGEVQVIDRLANGVFEVSTASHGGIMVKSDIADKIFSKEARDIAFKENGFMCFEEDCDATVAYRELIDKGIIEYPSDYNGSNADFDETINHAISYWFKDYWNKREEAIFKALPAEEQAEQTGQIMFGESAEEPVADNSPVGNSEYEGLLDAIETKHHIATTALLVNNYDLALRTLNEELELTEKAEKIRKSMPQHPLIFSVKQNDMTEYRVAEGLTVEDIKKIYAQSDRPYYALMQTGEPISEARFAEIEQSDRYGVVIDIDIDNGSMDIDTVTKRSVSLSDVVGEYKPIELEISDIDDIYMSEEGVYDAILSYTPSLEKVLIENSGLDTTDLRLDTAYLVYDENEDKLSVAEYSFSRGDERVYRETNFEITVSGEQKEKLVKQMKDRYYENEISDEYTPDELDTVLHLADENIGFTVVTLNDDEDFIVGGNVDLDDIKETEDYLEYVAGLDGETTSISVSKSFYTIGADVENNDAEDYQTEYIYNHLEDVLKMATLHEGIRYRVEIERDEEAEEETEEAEPIIEENSELIKALSEHRNIYFEDEPYKEQYVSDANDRRFTNRYFVFDDESSEYVFRGTTSLNGKNEDVYLRPLGSNAANIAQYIAENNLTVREYGEIPAQSEDIPIDPFKDNVAMGDLEENDFIFIPVHTAQNGSVTVPERYALVTEVSESGITLETYSDGDMTNSTGQQRINGDWAAQLENVGAVFVSTYDESLELPENPEMRYEIYQLKNGEAYRDYHFTGFSELKLYGLTVDTDNYDLVYSGRSATRLTAEDIFVKFNLQRPADFTGHSLSVSDVVVIDLYGSKQAFYVDSFGFAEVTDLFLGKERERIEVTDLASIRLREDYDKYVNNNIVFFHNYITFSNIQSENITRDKSFTYIDGTDHDNDEGTTLTSHRAMMSELAAYLETMRNDSARRIEITDLEGNVRTLKSFAFTFEDKTEITRDSRDIEIRGQEGKWRVVDAEVIDGEMLFELERDTGDEKVGTFGTNDTNILVDADKNVREVLIPKGHIAHYRVTQEIDKFRDNFIENRMPEIIRKMLTFDEMSALSDHIFTDYFSYKIGMVQNSIENSGRITVYSPDTDTELSHLHDAMNTDLEIAVSYEKTETGLKFVAANVEKEYTWEQITNFAVRAAEKWYDSSKENSYERMKEYLDNVVQNTNPEFHLTAGTFAVYAADTIVENIYKKYKFGFVDEAERVQESVDNFITNSEMFSHYVDKEVNSLLFNIGVGSTKFVSYGLDEVADLCRDFADNPETREYIINSVTIAVENEIIRRRNELVVDEQTEMKPSTLEIGDIIELDGKQWELYDTGFNVTFINNDPSDPEHSFTHIGGVSNFIETHDFTLIAKGKELEPDKADDTVSESSRVPVEKEAALDLWDNGIDVFINGQRANSRKEIEDCGTQWNEFSVSMVQYDEYSERNTPSEQLAEMEEAIEFPATPAVKDILYTNSYQQAVENGEEDAYVESRRISSDCRRDLDRFIEQYYTDYSLNTSAVIDAILKDYAPERVSFIFASNLAGKGYDGRVSKDNIQWAEAFMQNIPDELREWNGRFALSSHIGLVNLAATEFQKYLERSKEVPAVENEKITLSIDKLGIEVDFTAGQSISISEEWLDGMYDDENEYERKTVFSYNEDDGLNVDVTTTRNGQYWTPNSFDIADYYDNSPVVLDYVRRVVDNSLNRPDVYTLTVYDADGNEIAKSEKEELPEASEQTRAVTSEQQEANAEPKKSMGIVTLRKVGDFYEMYGKNAEIGADVLGITPISQNGGEMLRFAGDVESEYSEKLRDAGYSVLIEQVFELNPPRRNIELQTETERGAENSPVGNSTEQTVTEESHDFVITDDNFNAEGGAKTRFKANVEAIRLLQSIEAENRTATQAEQEILSRYVGWGGLSNAFDATKTDWVYEYSELQTLLSPEEYQAARASTVDAYFTSPVIIGAMYEALQNTGFNGGRILEPSCGSGNFFGAMPEALRDNSALFGVELDSLTARIAKQLYPSADIITSGFESTNFSNGSFDVAVGNVPFGEHIVFDREMKQANLHIHDYFIAKALDKVHEGGIVAFVTSQGTMDKRSPDARQYIAQRADLLGAIRLPVGVFSDIARTDAGADILFLQKRDRPLDIEPEWLHKTMLENGAEVNAYFASHPEMVLGELKVGINKMYGSIETVCYPIEGADIKEQLQEAIKNIHGEYRAEKRAEEQENLLADVEMKRFSYAVIEDKLYYRGSGNEITEVTGKNVPKIKAMIEIAGTVDKLLTLQVENYGNRNAAEISDAMTELNSQYDRFVEKYGRLSSSVRAMKRDDRTHILKSLEVKDREGNFVRKADIFNKPLINATKITEHVDNAYDALILSLNERLKVDLPYMEQVSGIPADQLIKELEGKIYQNPEKNMQWESADEYLTGNVLHKLEAAEEAGMTANVEALKAVQPERIEAQDISVNIGATWIDPEFIRDFILEKLEPDYTTSRDITVEFCDVTSEWKVDNFKAFNLNNAATKVYGEGSDFNSYRLLELALNKKVPIIKKDKLDEHGYPIRDMNGKLVKEIDRQRTKSAQNKQDKIKKMFKDWIFENPERRKILVDKYNRLFNNMRVREFDGSKLNFVGITNQIQLYPHQKNAIARALHSGNTLLAHEVGAGKTNEMIAIAMEGKRLGLHSKSLFAVPNHLTEQTGNAFRELYPNCNILVATENDFTPANRRDILAKIATGDYDAVILGHTQFDMIHLSEEIEREYIEDEIAEVRAALDIARADGADFSVKKIEAELKSLEARLYTLNQKTGKEDLIEFEKLGIDKIFVDESQNYKNLTTPTKLQGVAGLGSKGAGKSTQLLLKCRWLNEQTNYKGVIFSSGTPVSNSMTELYTLFRYLRPDLLKDANIHSFDKWLSVYAEIRTALELSVQGNGSFQLRTRVSKLSNLPEFMKMFKQFADIKTADTLNLKRPICEVQNVVVKPSVYQKRYVKKLGERADKIHAGNVDPRRDNMLKLTTDARKIGLDARCVNPDLPDSPNSKVNVCINNVFDIWQNTADIKGTQLIFCDLATPHKPENENTYSVFRKIDDAYVEIFTDKLPKNADVGIMFDKLCNKPPKAFKEAELTLQEGDIILTTNVDPKEEMAYRNAGVIEGKKIVTLENSQMEAALELEAVSSTNVEKTFCIYDDIKRKLIDMGIPEGEIAYIHDYEKPEDKQRLYDMINRGEIRVMIGSTQKCGAGMNAQKRMVALHDLDVPMRPSDMGQRRGRIERQGNEIPEVTIYRYCTEGTFDAYLYQMLENKQRAISQIMTSKSPNRSCDDIDELTLEWAETKAICSGSPLIKERVQLIIDIQTLNDIKASFLSDKYYLQEKLLKLPQELHYSEYRRERIQSDVDKVKEAANEDFSIEVNGKTYTNKEEGAEALKSYVLSHLPVLQTTMGGELHIGNYKGFNLSISSFKIEGDEYLFGYQFCLQRAYTHTCDANLTAGVKATGNITRLDNCLAAIEEKNLPQIDALIATQKSDLENLEKHINQPFDRQDELDAKEKRLAEVEEALVGLAAENNTPKELFEMVTDMFTGLEKDKEESIYLKSKSEVILPLLISPLGDNCYAMSHNYKQLGDFMDDPRIDFRLDFEKGTLDILSFTQSNMGMYEEYEGKPDAKADCEQFMLQWLDNITEQGFAPCSKEEWRQSVLEHSDDYEPREEKSTDEEVL